MGDTVAEAFDAAAQYVAAASSSGTLSDQQLLQLYGLYKQATAGACDTPKPSFFDRRGRAKWQAWQACSGLSSSQAQQQYVDLLTEFVAEWSGTRASSGSGPKRAGAGGPVQSRMADAAEEGPDSLPALLQAARAGNTIELDQLLQAGGDANQRGCEGETALHWAADRGQLQVLRLLLDHGMDVNAVDSDGQSALHYAALAEQQEAAQLLAAAPGVQLDLQNADGETAADLAPSSWQFLQNGNCRGV